MKVWPQQVKSSVDGSNDCDVGSGISGMEGSRETAMEDEDEFAEAPKA